MLDRELTIDDYFWFMANSEVEPLPSQKIDYAITMIRAQIAAATAQKKINPEDYKPQWTKKVSDVEVHTSRKSRAWANLVKYGHMMSSEEFEKAKQKIMAMED